MNGVIDSECRGDVLDDSAHIDRQSAGLHLTVHHSVNQLFLTTFRIFLHQRKHHDAVELRGLTFQLRKHFLNMLDRLRLVVLYCDRGVCYAESLLDQRGSNNDLLSLLKKCTEVGREVRLALATVDYQHLALLSRRRGQFHVGREGRSAESDDSAETDLLDDGLAVLRNVCHKGL